MIIVRVSFLERSIVKGLAPVRGMEPRCSLGSAGEDGGEKNTPPPELNMKTLQMNEFYFFFSPCIERWRSPELQIILLSFSLLCSSLKSMIMSC